MINARAKKRTGNQPMDTSKIEGTAMRPDIDNPAPKTKSFPSTDPIHATS
ncbi:MAG: hypothetical protein M0Q93_06460 [Terrimicrobiaceae bacterium]|nr:hypothetical protein [Terrimicrobiaceae bacterium]